MQQQVKWKKLLTVLAGNNWITAHEGDEALREYKNLVSNMVKDKRDEMIAFNIVKARTRFVLH